MPVPPPSNAKRVFEGVLHEVWQWDQELFDGSHTPFECVTRQDTVDILAFIDPETVLLNHEEQPGRDPFMDLPGGRVELGETAEQGALREFAEETGYHIGTIQHVRTKDFRGAMRFSQSVFIAKHLTPVSTHNPDLGERIRVERTAWNDVVALALKGALRSPAGMLAILSLEFDPDMRKLKEEFLAS